MTETVTHFGKGKPFNWEGRDTINGETYVTGGNWNRVVKRTVLLNGDTMEGSESETFVKYKIPQLTVKWEKSRQKEEADTATNKLADAAASNDVDAITQNAGPYLHRQRK